MLRKQEEGNACKHLLHSPASHPFFVPPNHSLQVQQRQRFEKSEVQWGKAARERMPPILVPPQHDNRSLRLTTATPREVAFCKSDWIFRNPTCREKRIGRGKRREIISWHCFHCCEDESQLLERRRGPTVMLEISPKRPVIFACLTGFLVHCLCIHFLDLLVLSTSCTDSQIQASVGMGNVFCWGGGVRGTSRKMILHIFFGPLKGPYRS